MLSPRELQLTERIKDGQGGKVTTEVTEHGLQFEIVGANVGWAAP